MTEEEKQKEVDTSEPEEELREVSEESNDGGTSVELEKALAEANDKYLRLYAEFENYKKFAAKNREELLKYANEDLMTGLLTVIDHLELALQHSSDSDNSESLAEGVELTLKEFKTVLEKNSLTEIDAMGKEFDPTVHHAMSQIESDESEENTVLSVFRKGYMLKDRVIRAALVGVAKKPAHSENHGETQNEN
ncbi:MAG: nucleotide exchange factor GrpE [Nitrospiraceae bacterium]|nr:MAG: nucleotide exchange factor GrpE [Nitrospiraceae bacterium]